MARAVISHLLNSTSLVDFPFRYAEAVSQFGSMIEVRVGRSAQNLPIFVRMLDKDSNWGYENGLKTMVTTLLQMSFAGKNELEYAKL